MNKSSLKEIAIFVLLAVLIVPMAFGKIQTSAGIIGINEESIAPVQIDSLIIIDTNGINLSDFNETNISDDPLYFLNSDNNIVLNSNDNVDINKNINKNNNENIDENISEPTDTTDTVGTEIIGAQIIENETVPDPVGDIASDLIEQNDTVSDGQISDFISGAIQDPTMENNKIKKIILPDEGIPPVINTIPVILLNNYATSREIDFSNYVEDETYPPAQLNYIMQGDDKVSVVFNGAVANVTILKPNDTFTDVLGITVTDPFGASAKSSVTINYLNVEKTTPPVQDGMSGRFLFQDRPYSTQSALLGQRTQFTYNLKSGWNFISLAVIPDDHHISQILAPINGYYSVIYSYAYNRYSNEWKFYSPEVPPPLNTLDLVDESMGFWILITADKTLTLNGYQVLSTDIKINKGWSMISFPSTTGASFSTALAPLNQYFTAIYGYDPAYTPNYWRMYGTELPPMLNTLSTLQPGLGYWVYSNQSMRWKFNLTAEKYELVEIDNNNFYEKKSYIFAGGKQIAQVDKDKKVFYYHSDNLGSGQVMTDSAGKVIWSQDYYPFGSQLSGTGTGNSMKFTGKEYDYSSGLYYYGARYMDPSLGRFISADPSSGDVKNPQSLNKYSYTLNNPFTYLDPDGKDAVRVNHPLYFFGFDVGHASLVAGNNKYGWTAYYYMTGEATTTLFDQIKVAFFNTRARPILGYGKTWQAAVIDLEKNGGYSYKHDLTHVAYFKTSDQQSEAIKQFMENSNKHPLLYNLENHNCAISCGEGLEVGGIKTPDGILDFIPTFYLEHSIWDISREYNLNQQLKYPLTGPNGERYDRPDHTNVINEIDK